MALTDESGMNTTMLVSPANNLGGMPYPVYQSGGAFNGFGGDNGWWIILLILLMAGGFNNGFGNNGGYAGGYAGGNGIYPWMNQANLTSNGFQNQMLNDNVTSIRDGIQALSTQLCGATGELQMGLANGFAGVEAGANARQIANMQTAFAAQTAMTQGFNNVQSQLAQCCCDNRLATSQTQNIVQNEGNATRFADANNTRDIIDSQTRGTQAILDKLCQLELDGVKAQVDAKNDRISELQTQLNMATLRESQTAQNAFISQGFANEVDQLYNRLSNCPVPTTPVYGRTPIFTCNNGCGCNGGSF